MVKKRRENVKKRVLAMSCIFKGNTRGKIIPKYGFLNLKSVLSWWNRMTFMEYSQENWFLFEQLFHSVLISISESIIWQKTYWFDKNEQQNKMKERNTAKKKKIKFSIKVLDTESKYQFEWKEELCGIFSALFIFCFFIITNYYKFNICKCIQIILVVICF